MDRDEWIRELEQVQDKYGFRDGYKFVYGPWETLDVAEVAFLSLNPGKASALNIDVIREIADERGNTYEVEQWTTVSPINDQFLRLARLLGRQPAEILTGVVVPFRSDDWDGLTPRQREKSLNLGRRFWKEPLSRPGLRLIITSGVPAAKLVVEITGALPDGEAGSGWGSSKLRRYSLPKGGRIVSLPHLSRFKLLSRELSKEKLRAFLDASRALAFRSA